MENFDKAELIVVIVNDGFSSSVIKYANEVFSLGATTIKGRGLGSAQGEEGVNAGLFAEKEVVLIIVPKEIRKKVMEKITLHLGLSSKAQGMVFSMPVDEYTKEIFNKENSNIESHKVEMKNMEELVETNKNSQEEN